MYTVALYLMELNYGGPEEGGWWYEEGELVKTLRTFEDEEAAVGYCARLSSRLRSRLVGPNAGRPSISSVASDGEYWAMMFEGEAPKYFPEETPHYE